jgi:hypothetical protein
MYSRPSPTRLASVCISLTPTGSHTALAIHQRRGLMLREFHREPLLAVRAAFGDPAPAGWPTRAFHFRWAPVPSAARPAGYRSGSGPRRAPQSPRPYSRRPTAAMTKRTARQRRARRRMPSDSAPGLLQVLLVKALRPFDVLSSLQSAQFHCCVLKCCTQGAHWLPKTQSTLQASGGTHAWARPGLTRAPEPRARQPAPARRPRRRRRTTRTCARWPTS